MKYDELLKKIKKETTGIAKGYSVSFLQNELVYRLHSENKFEEIIKRDLELFKSIEASLLQNDKPQEGDFVEYADNKFARISRKHQNEAFQLSNKIGVFVSEGSTLASGCTWDPEIEIENELLKLENLIKSDKTRNGSCWTFSGNLPGGNRGVYFDINFKIWKLKTTHDLDFKGVTKKVTV